MDPNKSSPGESSNTENELSIQEQASPRSPGESTEQHLHLSLNKTEVYISETGEFHPEFIAAADEAFSGMGQHLIDEHSAEAAHRRDLEKMEMQLHLQHQTNRIEDRTLSLGAAERTSKFITAMSVVGFGLGAYFDHPVAAGLFGVGGFALVALVKAFLEKEQPVPDVVIGEEEEEEEESSEDADVSAVEPQRLTEVQEE